MSMKTADLYDEHGDQLAIADPLFQDFGGHRSFCGPIQTVKVHEDNSFVRSALEEQGHGKVLVVDGGGSLRCALVGDRLAALGASNGWAGIIVYGCVRDTAELGQIPIGIKALRAHPAKSAKRGEGARNSVVRFAGVSFSPDAYLYADEDGIVVGADDYRGHR